MSSLTLESIKSGESLRLQDKPKGDVYSAGMTETHQIIALEELTKVRLTCANCKTTHEFEIDKLHLAFGNGACRYCESPWRFDASPGYDPFRTLGQALSKIAENDNFSVTFPVPGRQQRLALSTARRVKLPLGKLLVEGEADLNWQPQRGDVLADAIRNVQPVGRQ